MMHSPSSLAMSLHQSQRSTLNKKFPFGQVLDSSISEAIRGGSRRRNTPLANPGRGVPAKTARSPLVSATMYQINIAFNFILGGNNNSISTVQGNGVDGMRIVAHAPI
jgi:hypothetical protein